VTKPGDLTLMRQRMVNDTYEDWILFLDDDDLWYKESLDEIVKLLDENVDGYAVSPIQIIDQRYHDKFWYENKFFTKLFKNKNINYVNPWPRDLIMSGDRSLYWKKNNRVKKLFGKYFHLSGIKTSSFRKEKWTNDKYLEEVKQKELYPDWCKPHIEKIYAYH
jgi:GT2 family glycosyltransferase